MTKFEQDLLTLGYEKHYYNPKTKQLEQTDKHVISTMVNISYTYIHKITKDIITFGLNEKGNPPTLIYPRPSIIVHRDNNIVEYENKDSSANIMLMNETTEDILDAIKSNKVFKYEMYRC